jgi:hypothetical protein
LFVASLLNVLLAKIKLENTIYMRAKRFNYINLVLTSASCSIIGIVLFSQINKPKTDNAIVTKTIEVKTLPAFIAIGTCLMR